MNKTNKVNILFTCIGRRVSLIKAFEKGVKKVGLISKIIGTDKNQLSPALQVCDKKYIVSPVCNPSYINELLEIVKKEKIDLLVPTIDTELKCLAQNKKKFEKLGCLLLISSPKVVSICQDKRLTYKFLKDNGFDAPMTMSLDEALRAKRHNYPLFLKPWDGSASKGNQIVKNRDELKFFTGRIPNCIVQEFVSGTEFTCDVYVDFDMKVRCVVPRKRIEVRGGEVSKGSVEKDLVIMHQAAEVVSRLGAGPGVITIQLIANGKGVKFIEINPRFGGGAPLGIKAGANYPKWILQEMIGQKPNIKFDSFKDKLTMLRYDAEIWI